MENSRKKVIVKLILLAGACLLLLVGYKKEYNVKYVGSNEILSVAHRGASGFAPENTAAAFRKAIELGADFLEFDVQMSKDGELIIIHDDKVDRTTNGSGLVSVFTLEELKQLDAGGGYHEDFSGEQLITLQELMEEFHGHVGLLLEIKKPSMNIGIEEKVAEVLRQYSDLSNVIVQSFDAESMRKMNKLLPEIEIAVLMKTSGFSPSSRKIQELSTFATYINFNVGYVSKRTVKDVHRYGGKVFVWAIKDDTSVNKAIQYGVDGMISDFSQWPSQEQLFATNE
ncbi:glycerophosphodiester phosphodiesterase [Sporosarcina sp. CAU 1771]